MSPAQRTMLWSMFRSACRARGWRSDNATRDQLTRDALGSAASWSDLTNPQIDQLKTHLRAIIDPESLAGQLATLDSESAGERKRLIYAIERTATAAHLDDRYIQSITASQDLTEDWRSLPVSRLRQLRYTITARASRKRRSSSVP